VFCRDLKPENVLLRRVRGTSLGAVAKLADFGLSVRMAAHQSHISGYYKGAERDHMLNVDPFKQGKRSWSHARKE
jgi:serine/threonine protein kinase